MSPLSTIESPRVAPGATPPEQSRRPAKEIKETGEVMSSFALQGASGFLVGALIALICTAGTALEPFDKIEIFGRFIGFALGGALGGAAVVWGSRRKHGARNAAFGFALGFLVAAYVVGAAAGHLLTVKPEAFGIGTFVGSALACTIGYGVAGAIGGAFVMGRLFFAGAVRFGLAGLVGSFVLSMVPAFNFSTGSVTPKRMAGLVAALILGHLIPFAGGGWWFGRAVANEERVLRKNSPKR